ncbi:MAG: phospho-sugar mutase [Anaerovoracaceae bacterium]
MKERFEAWKAFLKERNAAERKDKELAEIDRELLEQLEAIENDENEMYEHFYKEIEFGTAGLRGILGVGTNRMNIYTVAKATEGLAQYIRAGEYINDSPVKKANGESTEERPSVAVAYDSRLYSKAFAEITAGVLTSNGINVYLYKELMPVPALSFAVRAFGCAMGVMITASHNPAQYNGYKVYDNTGCQITPGAAKKIYGFIEKVNGFDVLKDNEEPQGELKYIEEAVVEAYLDAVQKESTNIDKDAMAALGVVYTPLNGAGNKCVRKILERIGVEKVTVVKEQELPDGNFPTCTYPNPEKKEALSLGLELCRRLAEQAEKEGKPENIPDLLIATDPDCDRIGTAVRKTYGGKAEYMLLTGNDIGVLLLDFLIERKVKTGQKKNPRAFTTIVSTKMTDAVAKKHGVKLVRTLTGFKFIGEQIALLENDGKAEEYLFGFEESYGYLSGTSVRDKDAVNAAMLICEMAAYCRQQGMTPAEKLESLYKEYGYFKDRLMDFAFEGAKGMETMALIMSGLRTDMPEAFAGKNVTEITDYKKQEKTGLPKSDVISVTLEDGTSFTVRPSGTEPKLKIYMSAAGKTEKEAIGCIEALQAELEALVGRVAGR